MSYTNNSEYSITTFTRSKHIYLQEGKPFKDMVYEEVYNYYAFQPPNDSEEVEIFLTILSGKSTLVTSKIFKSPELLYTVLGGNDIKTSSSNIIKYNKNEDG